MLPDICGDGVKKSSEKCDDGNSVDGDGCTKTCNVEIGFYCFGGSQFGKDRCEEICGDGRKVGKEQCDDGNVYGGDGCDENCTIEPLFRCEAGIPNKCYLACGNG
jgi:cysteine-rich repeat protein